MDLREARQLALARMDDHGLLELGWRFEFDNAKARNGICKHSRKTICLSRYYVALNDISKVLNTILHEIAHALTPGAKHGPEWKAKAKQIGCTGERCTSGVEQGPARYMAECCGGISRMHKRGPRFNDYVCNTCKQPIRWMDGNVFMRLQRQKSA